MYSANVHSWIETLLTGTPAPAHCGAAAVAVPAAAPRLRPVARATATRPRNTRPRPLDPFMSTPFPSALAAPMGERRPQHLLQVVPALKRRAFPGVHSTCASLAAKVHRISVWENRELAGLLTPSLITSEGFGPHNLITAGHGPFPVFARDQPNGIARRHSVRKATTVCYV